MITTARYFLFTLMLVFSANFVSTSSAQAAQTCCVCQTGQGPSVEKPFYRAGCRIWLNSQKNCDLKETIEYSHNHLGDIPNSCDGGEVILGFVGHWASVHQSMSFLDVVIEEGMNRRGMSFDIDNTACYAMDRPEIMRDRLQGEAIPEGQYLRFTGNQVLSVGVWDDIPVASGRSNVYATYDSRDGKITFPACSEFEAQQCSATFGIQRNQTARCKDKSGELKEITCCSVHYSMNSRLQRGSQTRGNITANLWVEPHMCGQRINR